VVFQKKYERRRRAHNRQLAGGFDEIEKSGEERSAIGERIALSNNRRLFSVIDQPHIILANAASTGAKCFRKNEASSGRLMSVERYASPQSLWRIRRFMPRDLPNFDARVDSPSPLCPSIDLFHGQIAEEHAMPTGGQTRSRASMSSQSTAMPDREGIARPLRE